MATEVEPIELTHPWPGDLKPFVRGLIASGAYESDEEMFPEAFYCFHDDIVLQQIRAERLNKPWVPDAMRDDHPAVTAEQLAASRDRLEAAALDAADELIRAALLNYRDALELQRRKAERLKAELADLPAPGAGPTADADAVFDRLMRKFDGGRSR